MGVPLPRCDARLESRWRYLETVRASCRRAQRCAATRKTGAYCRASAPASGCAARGPFLYGLDVGNWPWVVVAESAGHGNSSQGRQSPVEEVRRRGVRKGCCRWKPPHALGGLLCGRRGAPEGCAIALPRGRAGGGVAVGCRRMLWKASYVGGWVRRRGVP